MKAHCNYCNATSHENMTLMEQTLDIKGYSPNCRGYAIFDRIEHERSQPNNRKNVARK